MNFKDLLSERNLIAALISVVAALASVTLGRQELWLIVLGLAVAFFIFFVMIVFSKIQAVEKRVNDIYIKSVNDKVSEDLNIISMNDFIRQEGKLSKGDSVLLFLSTLDYDRRYFSDVISKNLNRGVKYYYILGGAEAKKDWMDFVSDLEEKGAKCLPEVRFNTPNIAPLIWTTAVYQFKDMSKGLHAISILEHIYDSDACIELSLPIAKIMKQHFWKHWEGLSVKQ